MGSGKMSHGGNFESTRGPAKFIGAGHVTDGSHAGSESTVWPEHCHELLHRGRRRRRPPERGAMWWLVLIELVFLCLFNCPVFIRSLLSSPPACLCVPGTLPHLCWPPRYDRFLTSRSHSLMNCPVSPSPQLFRGPVHQDLVWLWPWLGAAFANPSAQSPHTEHSIPQRLGWLLK